ncbi:uncharacterized protein HMPREF1541_09765 [Cyphellophora europaea CBS 101466]|uniref:RRM domain-containing protein n=1 Tax=Cyphellophora europaea (strain CBS 101466) TaxID=1220924 RepID=W2S8E6_CYPE1|nr:uncharacterized protein HMPREF1541_09765 [Cyphellophora europaea CBS 101466]ETN44890.1 hypothetical protein HMPREF1541_09765 [Cyphellophora europaea CBS 101466]
MTDKLPPDLLQLFQPRPPVRYLQPLDNSPEERGTKGSELSGIAAFLGDLQEHKENDNYVPTESWLQKRDRKRLEKQQRAAEMQKEDFQGFKPSDDPKIKGDALKTLFVGRLSYDVKEQDLEREFGRFGPVERIRIVKDETSPKSKKPHRGYAFIVYERERDMKAAYKDTDGIKIKDRKVVVDVERGRMVPGWRPRRFGGGLGGRGYTRLPPPRPTFGGGPGGYGGGGGFRGGFGGRGGGFRGGFRGDRGGYGGGRGGIGYQERGGFANRAPPPPNAPSGPGGRSGGYGGGGGYDDRRNGYGDRDRNDRSGSGYGRDRDRGGITGSNREPVGSRDRGYEDRDRRRDDYDSGSRKRHHENDYDDPRQRRRY